MKKHEEQKPMENLASEQKTEEFISLTLALSEERMKATHERLLTPAHDALAASALA